MHKQIENSLTTETTISGAAIMSTIAGMAALGHIGEKVLKDIGVTEIDPEKQYPYTVRSAILEVAYERFGEDALFAFGLRQTNLMKGQFSKFEEKWNEFYTQRQTQLSSPDNND